MSEENHTFLGGSKRAAKIYKSLMNKMQGNCDMARKSRVVSAYIKKKVALLQRGVLFFL